MAVERTFSMIKPDTYQNRHVGQVLAMIEEAGFTVVHAMLLKMTEKAASQFYEIHKGKEFFDGLVKFTVSDKVMVLVLEKESAISDFRKLIGNTNPADAGSDTIRGRFGSKLPRNSVHGSDSSESAKREITYFFGEFASIPSTEKSVAKEY